jgi:hypothetical protein
MEENVLVADSASETRSDNLLPIFSIGLGQRFGRGRHGAVVAVVVAFVATQEICNPQYHKKHAILKNSAEGRRLRIICMPACTIVRRLSVSNLEFRNFPDTYLPDTYLLKTYLPDT